MLFVESTKLFISNNVRVYRYVCEILQLYVPGVWLLTPFSVPRGGLYTMVVLGEGFLLPSSRVPGGGIVMDEIDACIKVKR